MDMDMDMMLLHGEKKKKQRIRRRKKITILICSFLPLLLLLQTNKQVKGKQNTVNKQCGMDLINQSIQVSQSSSSIKARASEQEQIKSNAKTSKPCAPLALHSSTSCS